MMHRSCSPPNRICFRRALDERESRPYDAPPHADLTGTSLGNSLFRLHALSTEWREIQPVKRVQQLATRLLRVHPVRAADALQLAAAIIASEDQPATLPFVTLDDCLAQAAEREGFPVVRPDRAD